MKRFLPSPALSLLAGLFLVGGAAGCGGDRPPAPPIETVPVQGKIHFKNNIPSVERLEGGSVWFKSTSDAKLTAVGSIREDGSFTMSTFFAEKGFDGVPAGKYKVRVEPPPDDDEGKPRRDLIHPKYLDYDKSGIIVTVPLADELTIVVERPRR